MSRAEFSDVNLWPRGEEWKGTTRKRVRRSDRRAHLLSSGKLIDGARVFIAGRARDGLVVHVISITGFFFIFAYNTPRACRSSPPREFAKHTLGSRQFIGRAAFLIRGAQQRYRRVKTRFGAHRVRAHPPPLGAPPVVIGRGPARFQLDHALSARRLSRARAAANRRRRRVYTATAVRRRRRRRRRVCPSAAGAPGRRLFIHVRPSVSIADVENGANA